MIALTKTKEPDVLVNNSARWTEEILALITKGETPTSYQSSKYNHVEIKDALLSETYSKCAYCESKFEHVTYGDIEHIIPKSIQPELRFLWENLTIACGVCNTNKSNIQNLVDPYNVNPDDLFDFFGSTIFPLLTNDSAVITEKTIKLNRPALIERRTERIKYIQSLVYSAISKPDDVKDAMIADAKSEVASDKEYSACTKRVLNYLCSKYGL